MWLWTYLYDLCVYSHGVFFDFVEFSLRLLHEMNFGGEEGERESFYNITIQDFADEPSKDK
jgi:hypothetical protein